ncbi:hypothetical protein LCGC14_1009360 [marine sediment metagenome]|uniref:Uncharacterized protein n=1 Tax=marine sediment metagenome TaxID=412755 RepID=A0A0F9NM28_9ZZZZ
MDFNNFLLLFNFILFAVYSFRFWILEKPDREGIFAIICLILLHLLGE